MKFETRSPDRAPEHISTLKTLGRIRRFKTSLVAVILGFAVSGPVAMAQRIWDGGGNGTVWSTGNGNNDRSNWDGNTAYVTGQNVIFAGNIGLNPSIGAALLTGGSITFDSTAGAFTIGGSGTLTINGGIANNDNSLQSFSVSTITLGAAQTWNAGTVSGGELAFTGTTLNLGTSQILTIAGTNNTSISNLITGTGTSGILKTGTGALTLSNSASTYAGATTIRGGSLIVGANAPNGSAGALGNTTSDIVLGDGSTVAGDAPALLINGAFTVGRAITVGSVTNTAAYNATIGGSNTAGTSTFSGNITLNTTAANYTTTLQAATGGTVDFVTGTWTTNNKAIVIGSSGNTGTVKLSNTLSTTGGISVNFGTFLLGSSDRLGDTTPVTVAGGIFDTGTALTDTVSTFNMSSGSLNGTGTITATTYGLSGGTVNGNLGTGTVNVTTGTVTLNGTAAALAVNVNSGTLALGANERLADGATVTVAGGILDTTPTNYSDTVGTFNMSSGSLNGGGLITATTYGLSGGTVGANLGTGTVNVTTGTVNLNGTSAATTVNVNSGTLLLGSSDRLANTAAVNVGGGDLDIAGNSDTVGIVTLTNGSISGTSGVLTGSSYLMQNGSVSAILGGSASLSKSTGGTLALSGANTYSGNTSLTDGTLLINNTSGSATGSGNVTTGPGTFLAGNGIIELDLNKAINIGGTLIVGDDGIGSIQDLDFKLSNGSMAFASTSLIKMDLFNGFNSGTLNGSSSADLLNFTGLLGSSSISWGGTLKFSSSLGSFPASGVGDGANWAAGSSWQLFAWTGISSVSGNFTSITGLPDLSLLNLDWDTTQLNTTGILSIVAIPEPRMTTLVVLGLLTTTLRRRRSIQKL